MARAWCFAFGLAIAVIAALVLCGAGEEGRPVHTDPIVVHVERDGFHWPDAGIGALCGIGISLAVCGCIALVRLRHAEITSPTKGRQP
jgi:hypothetical protein